MTNAADQRCECWHGKHMKGDFCGCPDGCPCLAYEPAIVEPVVNPIADSSRAIEAVLDGWPHLCFSLVNGEPPCRNTTRCVCRWTIEEARGELTALKEANR